MESGRFGTDYVIETSARGTEKLVAVPRGLGYAAALNSPFSAHGEAARLRAAQAAEAEAPPEKLVSDVVAQQPTSETNADTTVGAYYDPTIGGLHAFD